MHLDPAAVLADLNPPQREAVETLSGPLLILAGAGSGKTRVVTRRIAHLIARGIRPWEIIAITFTNKAAAEMRRRVEQLVGEGGGIWLSTFHSFCARLLRREAPVLGMAREFTIYDEEDAQDVLAAILKGLALEDKRYTPRSLRSLISRLKSRALRPDELSPSSFHQRIVHQVYTEYAARLQRNSALDFDDLLLRGLELLRDHPEVREKYAARFRHLLVDEYQDTNGCQYQLVKLLGQGHRNVCVTGDPDQSIYAWRGADLRNILAFEKDFPEAKVVRLEQNYRSTKNILAAAQAVIRRNVDRKEKELWTEHPAGAKPRLILTADSELEAAAAAEQIQKLVSEERRYGEIAVFYRTNSQSRAFETACVRENIPYCLVGGTPFYERREVKDALAYLRLLVNPKDDLSFRRIVNVPRRGLGPSALEGFIRQAAALNASLLETISRPEGLAEQKPRARQEAQAFAGLLDALRRLPQYPVKAVVEAVLDRSGLRKMYEELGEEERTENLDELLNAAALYDERNPPAAAPPGPPPEPGAYDDWEANARAQASLSGFLENAALVQATDTPRAGGARPRSGRDDDRVTLMTLHMAKGLEFPFVFIAGLEEGLLPLLRESGPKDGFEEHDEKEEDRRLEEERRLFYVGLTRAQERVWLLRAAWRMRYGRSEPGVPSRFLDEIPEKLLETENRARAVSALLPERRAWRNEWSQEPWPRREGRGGRFHRRRRGW